MSIAKQKPIICVVLGPTASGKSELAVKIALWTERMGRKAEIISADSRQVYQGLDIGSGKVPGVLRRRNGKSYFTYKEIHHHLISIANPRRTFTVSDYQKKGQEIIGRLLSHGTLPIICGGTGLYIDSLLSDIHFPNVKPNTKLRHILEKQTIEELYVSLKEKDPAVATRIDRNNKRRLIRALEIVMQTGATIPQTNTQSIATYLTHYGIDESRIIIIGIQPNNELLKRNIHKRLSERLKKGMVREVIMLHKKRVSWKRFYNLGLEYRYIAQYLTKHISEREMIENIKKESMQYAKRQMTWWKRNKRILWEKTPKSAYTTAIKFIKKSATETRRTKQRETD